MNSRCSGSPSPRPSPGSTGRGSKEGRSSMPQPIAKGLFLYCPKSGRRFESRTAGSQPPKPQSKPDVFRFWAIEKPCCGHRRPSFLAPSPGTPGEGARKDGLLCPNPSPKVYFSIAPSPERRSDFDCGFGC